MQLEFSDVKTSYAGPFTGSFVGPGVMGLVGRSGCGKSTLLKCLSDLIPHDGQVALDGVEQTSKSGDQWRSMVRYLHSDVVWWENSVIDHFPDRDRRDLSGQLELLGLAPDILDQPVSSLSTGEGKRLGLVRALQGDPPVLLLDEPASNLDSGSQEMVTRMIRKLRDRLVVVISHEHAWLEQSTDTILNLDAFLSN